MKIQHLGTAVLVAGGLLMQTLTAQADLKYTKEMRMGDDPKAAPMQVITTMVRKNARREETRGNYGPMQMNSVTLTLCEKKQSIQLDPKLKIYTVSALDENGIPIPQDPAGAADQRDTGPAGTGKIIMTTNIQDLGEETVAGFKARHYMITSQMEMTGCAGDMKTSTKMETWVTDIREPMACETGNGDPSRAYNSYKPNCKVTFEQKGDKDAYTKAYSGMILRMKMYDEKTGKLTMIQDTTQLSQAKIEDDSLFTIPAGFKQVSAAEFQQAQSKAMMDAMMAGAKGNAGGGNGGDGNGGGNDNDGGNDAGDAGGNDANNGDNDANNGGGQNANDRDNQPKEEQKPKKEEKKKKNKFKIPGLPF